MTRTVDNARLSAALKVVPLDQRGLCAGLKTSNCDAPYRCNACNKMQPAGPMVYVPDSVLRGDPAWSVTDACRRNALNGFSSGWCPKCARRLGRGTAATVSNALRTIVALDQRARRADDKGVSAMWQVDERLRRYDAPHEDFRDPVADRTALRYLAFALVCAIVSLAIVAVMP